MKKVVVLGAGMVGSAIAADLSRECAVTSVDADAIRLERLAAQHPIAMRVADLRDPAAVRGGGGRRPRSRRSARLHGIRDAARGHRGRGQCRRYLLLPGGPVRTRRAGAGSGRHGRGGCGGGAGPQQPGDRLRSRQVSGRGSHGGLVSLSGRGAAGAADLAVAVQGAVLAGGCAGGIHPARAAGGAGGGRHPASALRPGAGRDRANRHPRSVQDRRTAHPAPDDERAEHGREDAALSGPHRICARAARQRVSRHDAGAGRRRGGPASRRGSRYAVRAVEARAGRAGVHDAGGHRHCARWRGRAGRRLPVVRPHRCVGCVLDGSHDRLHLHGHRAAGAGGRARVAGHLSAGVRGAVPGCFDRVLADLAALAWHCTGRAI